jgi:undecaprenyl-diphosphatase
MTIFGALFLGILQGLTEFLPVSSSGHLVLAQKFIPGFSQPGVLFDTVLHGGTLVAVIVYFRERILKLSKEMIFLILIATIPAGIVGVIFNNTFAMMFAGIGFLGIEFLISGIMNYLIDLSGPSRNKIGLKDSLIIGIAQALAIIPAISRSSATIFSATVLGIKRREAAEFSFLLSIPAIAGAMGFELLKSGLQNSIAISYYLAGFLAAMIIGFLSISVLIKLLLHKNFKIFAYYCFLVGVLVLLLLQ